MNRTYFLFFLLGILCLNGTSQNRADSSLYFYYKGEKQYIELNTQQAFVSVPLSEFSNKAVNLSQYSIGNVREGINATCSEIEFNSKLSPQAYLEKLSALNKGMNGSVKGYLKMGSDEKVGLSDYFYVRLKELSDTAVLYQKAKEFHVEVVSRNEFLPHWFVLKSNALPIDSQLQVVNSFYESGLFQVADPEILPGQSLEMCANDSAGADLQSVPFSNHISARITNPRERGVGFYHRFTMEYVFVEKNRKYRNLLRCFYVYDNSNKI
jgi:hypothetical protein